MIGRAPGQVQLGEDAAYVLLLGAFGYEDPAGDTGIGPALGRASSSTPLPA
jgi:hypothetical protein